MSWYDALLFLHVLGAFSIVATLVFYGALVLSAVRGAALVPALRARLARLGGVLFDLGGTLTLVFGIWLAIYVDGYRLWDGWIVAALALWAFAAWVGTRLRGALARDDADLPLRYGLLVLDVVALFLLMVFKPGA